jgi:hypothetical protein
VKFTEETDFKKRAAEMSLVNDIKYSKLSDLMQMTSGTHASVFMFELFLIKNLFSIRRFHWLVRTLYDDDRQGCN